MLRPWTQVVRSLARRAGFAASAIVILGAGIAITTAVFSIVDAAVLEPLPYPNPDRLVVVLEANSAKSDAAGLLAPGRVEDWNRLNHTFDAISASYAENVTETSGEVPERLASRRTSPRFFTVYGVRPALGRAFLPEEEVNGGAPAVVISDHLCLRRFQRSRNVLAQRLTLGGIRYAIVGVMPASFGDRRVDLWIPAQFGAGMLQSRDARFMTGVGRMKRGVTLATAQRDLAGVQAELGREFPKTDKDWSAQLTDLKTSLVGDYRQPLIFVLGSVALLMLIALANTAGLMLTQLQRREGELAVRGLLGATRRQVVIGVLEETLILVAAAVVLAIAADVFLLRLAAPALASLPGATSIGVDWRALAVASLCGLAAAVACGLVPAWRATGHDVAATCSRAGRGISSDTRSQRLLVGAQIGIAMLLLSSTGLMLRSYYNLWHVDAGFEPSHAVTFHVGAAWDEDRAAIGQMQQRFVSTLSNMPGVTAVGFSNFLPASNATLRYQVHLQGVAREESSSERTQLTVGVRSVTTDYFRAIGARVSAGTGCPALADVKHDTPKALVNRRFIAAYAAGTAPQSLLGRYVSWAQQPGPPMEVVGIVDDIREDNLRTPAVPYLYTCLAPGDWPDPEYVVRANGDPAALLRAIRTSVHDIAPSRAVFGAMPLDDYVAATLGQTRLQTQMIAAFGLAAVALAAIGLYGLVALAVSTRRREIGIRIALGAAPSTVVREVVSRAGWVIVAGAGGGLVVAAIAQRALRAVVFGVAPLDPLTLLGAIIALGMISGVATLLPASRAARVDPVSAMRDG